MIQLRHVGVAAFWVAAVLIGLGLPRYLPYLDGWSAIAFDIVLWPLLIVMIVVVTRRSRAARRK